MHTEDEITGINHIFRGSVLSSVITLEKGIDLFIANYFCNSNEKVDEIILHLLGNERITLDNKKQIALAIITKNSFPIKPMVTTSQSQKQTVRTQLEEIVKERNIFAHCDIVTPSSHLYQPDKLVFYKLRDQKILMVYDNERIDFINLIARYYAIEFYVLSEQVKMIRSK